MGVLIVPVGLQNAYAQTTLTNEQLQLISANCQSAKNTLNQLHVTDALLRVNRGQLYEAVKSKLIDRFNSRLSSNGKDTAGLLVVTNGYANAFNSFRQNYIAYERQLSAAIRIDCDTQPAQFHNAVEEARALRLKLHEDVGNLHEYIDDYRSAVNDLILNDKSLRGEE
mgnify:CR=1 FL=1